MHRISNGLLIALFAAGLCAGCKREKTEAKPPPGYKPLGVTFDTDAPRPVTDPSDLLHRAIVWRKAEAVRDILQKNPQLVNKPLKGSYPILLACESGSKELVQAVLAHKPDLAVKGHSGYTALWVAAYTDSDDLGMVKDLIALGADPKVRGASGETLLWVVRSNAVAKYLIAQGVDPKAQDKAGNTALHIACARAQAGLVEVLLDSGLDVETPGQDKMRPLHCAAAMSSGDARPVANVLLTRGAKVDSRGYKGQTALHECALTNRVDLAALLLARGADVMAKNDEGQTPMDVALLVGKEERKQMINLLIDHGAPGSKIPLRHVEP